MLCRRCCHYNSSASLFLLLLLSFVLLPCRADKELLHPDPNDENYENMIYIGRHHHHDNDNDDNNNNDNNNNNNSNNDNNNSNNDNNDNNNNNNNDKTLHSSRVGFHTDNSIRYIFGTSFDETHKAVAEEDLLHDRRGSNITLDIPQQQRTRDQALQQQQNKPLDDRGPKPFGHVDVHPLDGGVVPPIVVAVEPFFIDTMPVTNKEYGKFVRATLYSTEAEHYGWSFVLSSFLPNANMLHNAERDPEAEHWVATQGAYWRRPEGPETSYKYRENHPVVHVSHRDAAEYCTWVGKRLPGEREWEAAARAGQYGPNNRTIYTWGDSQEWTIAKQYANLWGEGLFPSENHAEDGWRGTSPVQTYPPNKLGMYDMTGNVWEWMRGGKHKQRIVRGGSFVDSLDGSFNHAATLGTRSTLHGTTTTANVGFRCVKSPKRRVEHHYVYHDEEVQGHLAVEDQYGHQDHIPQQGWKDKFQNLEEEEDHSDKTTKRKKKKVIKPRTITSDEL